MLDLLEQLHDDLDGLDVIHAGEQMDEWIDDPAVHRRDLLVCAVGPEVLRADWQVLAVAAPCERVLSVAEVGIGNRVDEYRGGARPVHELLCELAHVEQENGDGGQHDVSVCREHSRMKACVIIA